MSRRPRPRDERSRPQPCNKHTAMALNEQTAAALQRGDGRGPATSRWSRPCIEQTAAATPRPEKVGIVYASLQEHLQPYARIRIHRAEVRPEACYILERIAQVADPDARVWRGSGDSDLLPAQQEIPVLGTPLGHPSFDEAHLELKVAEQRTLLERIPMVPDLQSAWLVLLHCASARANYLLRVVVAHKPRTRSRHQKFSEFAARPWGIGGAQRITSECGSVLGELG